ncbi:MAG: M48 family metallopeptidase [Acidobacteriaceae bacterium]|nr:M48 family metallopeptidase [Acidobacteriaceae bacterium]
MPLAAQPSSHFDAAAATDAWLASVPSAARAKSDAYFEGGYWLLLWDFLYGAAVMLLLLETRLSARLRDLAERVTRFRWLQSWAYWMELAIVTAILTFPLTLYEDFFREHQYGLSNQNFASWFRDQLIALALVLVLGGIGFTILVGIVRRLPRSWHIWGTGAAIIFLIIGALIAPVYIAPLFNTYKPLQNPAIKNQILSLAHANGIPASNVYEVNASRQSKRVSANVSGLFGTERITLNDNLLNRCSPQAIMAVMGHEMGHYVLHHIYNSVIFAAIVVAAMFAILRWAMDWALSQRGERWQIRGVDDTAALPLAVLILSILGFLYTPIGNTYTRTQEYEADIFGLNASREPDGEAEADLLLGEYRKLDPTPIEEFIFFDHPSGRTRILAAMRWKAQNLCLFDRSLLCSNPPK